MPVVDLLAVAALVALLVVAYRHPRRRVEALVSVGATLVVVATGLVGLDHARETVLELAPVVGFLVAILVVAQVCDRAGLFQAGGGLLRGGSAVRLLTVAFLLAAAVTAVLSLDATVVLLTPVVVAAAAGSGVPGRPAAYACLRMANSASLLLPVSNLTNLLALPSLGLTFAGFAATMAPVLVVVLVVEYAGLRLLFRRDLTVTARPDPTPAVPLPVVPTVVVGLMLAGFAVTSPLDVDPVWVAAAAAVVLVVWARHRGLLGLGDAVAAAHPEFALLVLALGVVVAALSDGFLGDAVADVVPDGTSYAALLGIALLATVLANALTNLSATLLLVPLVAPLGDVAVLAALVGLNVGSGLTLSGSLANLLWRRTLRADGQSDARTTSLVEFHRVSLLLTPVSLVAAVTVLHLVA
ncbi:SLC13 family permease [Nocardioides sp.]|uniref:SLC13 family permease n=1 Tax=Nocardioides sp. TaxID=35761 RepID=UPI002723D826|nr:SLC13 family permease [Nocardioides sp.]MDO9456940.1 ArsB/NhaD family transporter [Nocardioides sp.]